MVRAEAPALWPELLWTDGFHPSPLGSLLAALVLARWLVVLRLPSYEVKDASVVLQANSYIKLYTNFHTNLYTNLYRE